MHLLLRRWALPILLMFGVVGCEPSPPPGTAVGQKAPEIEGKDPDGKVIRLSELRGKVVLLDFWASWCAPCLRLVPAEKELANLYKGRPFTILGINADRDLGDLQAYLANANLPWPNIIDRTGDISKGWGIDSLPSFVLIDEEGVIRGRWRGGQEFGEAAAMTGKLVRTLEQR